MTKDELIVSLNRIAQDLIGWFSVTLKISEGRTDQEIRAIVDAILNQARLDGFDDDDYFMLWEIFDDESIGYLDKPDLMEQRLGFKCTPPLEVSEYGLILGLILASSAVEHFQSKSHRRHLLAAHLLTSATEARDQWIFIRGRTNCRNPDDRLVKAKNSIKRHEAKIWFPELLRATRSQAARHAANAMHSKPGGSRDKQENIRAIWASGKYTNRDLCAEQECAYLKMSFSTARKALRNIPKPT